jgi:hypothetical protein
MKTLPTFTVVIFMEDFKFHIAPNQITSESSFAALRLCAKLY